MKARAPISFLPVLLVLAGALLLVGRPLGAQTSSPGPGIDIELINPDDGSNTICVDPGQTFTVRLWLHPGTGTTNCSLSCGTVQGGTSSIATAVIDIDYDETALSFVDASNNPDSSFAAKDGLIQDHSSSGHVGWALAGDWDPDATPTGSLAPPCSTTLLDTPGWLAEFTFTAGSSPSSSTLHLRRQTDPQPFALSCADFCSPTAFTPENGGIDEVIDMTVYVSTTCPVEIFSDGFESSDMSQWSGGTG